MIVYVTACSHHYMIIYTCLVLMSRGYLSSFFLLHSASLLIFFLDTDIFQMDWLNKFIHCMWPYLDKVWAPSFFSFFFFGWSLELLLWKLNVDDKHPQGICNTVKKIAEPIIAEQIPKYKIESVEFQALTLGSLAPTFQGGADSFSLVTCETCETFA